ncbi:MAG: nitrous oxide reductase accessory protein NosL [Bacteroidia bacterium]|nr:nitrous oxide reductase accessory protein NosL [Bacteroidia bacterium]NNF31692.1 hypothetical protein [Flavobacteriaceae bacterium]NNJ81551.1 hypothetical protein [Flavobacteriaceae bacterium]NNK55206.1 hypothetical protein [Flavobacteriaceae bacterium]NNM10201.1 hypothetical protein [Flavobacteriaceae bacterium]
MNKFLLIPLVATLLCCAIGPSKIAYGEQACHFCRMTIVDKQHAAQLITDKGKVFNFDASECMINYITGIDRENIGLLLVTDYNNPESLIEVETATFIISEDMPSPMGANLSAIGTLAEAQQLIQDKQGKLYNWNELLQYFKNL